LILNFTGNVYHWGCHGTSAEIYQSLLERGYQVNWLDVRTTHTLTPQPAGVADFTSVSFFTTFFKMHPNLEFALQEADVVVVNGEGTLHHLNRAPLNLLFLMHAAGNVFGRPVHLINHSFFPFGDTTPHEVADALYGAVARTMGRVVPREPASRAVLTRLGVECEQGFDCLPRYITRHGFAGASSPAGPILLSGGVNMGPTDTARIAQALRPLLGGRRHCFLVGAKTNPAPEDADLFAQFRANLPGLELVTAASMEDWLGAIAGASCLVSGRYHHSIAAAALGTPFVVFPSNTPKIEATCAHLGLPAPLAYGDPEFVGKLGGAVADALAGRGARVSSDASRLMLTGADKNFTGL
jgi:polysaccharide pyruvyl transferase WcaK-like protein